MASSPGGIVTLGSIGYPPVGEHLLHWTKKTAAKSNQAMKVLIRICSHLSSVSVCGRINMANVVYLA